MNQSRHRNLFLILFLISGIGWSMPGLSQVQQLPNPEPTIPELEDYLAGLDDSVQILEIARAHITLAEKYLLQIGNHDLAISHFNNAVDHYWAAGDTIAYYGTLYDLATCYESTGYLAEAKSIFSQMYDQFATELDTSMLLVTISALADIALAEGALDSSLALLEEVRDSRRLFKDSVVYQIASSTIATINQSGDNREIITDTLAIMLAQRQDTLDTPNYLSTLLLNNGTYYQAQNRIQLALYYFRRSLEAAGINAYRRKESLVALANCHRINGDYEKAFSYLTSFTYLNDSIFNRRRLELLEGLTLKNAELEEKQQSIDVKRDLDIAEFKNRINRLVNYGLIFGALIILVVSYLIIRNYQERLNTNQIISKQKEEITKQRITDLENNLKIETMHSMIIGQEAERERIAKDLHDSLGGLLSTVKLHFDAVQAKNEDISSINEYQRANMLLDEACKEIRNISNNMQPGALLELGIVAAINDLINRLQSSGKPEIDFQHFGINGTLDTTISLNIYRIVQELLHNSIKHARADEILVQLIRKDDELIVMVEDDGIGFDSNEVEKGMGTENIASRINYLKGDLSVHSVKGTGTTTMINIPLSEQAEAG